MKTSSALWTVVLAVVFAVPTIGLSQDEREDPPRSGQEPADEEEALEVTTEDPPELPAAFKAPPTRWQPPRPAVRWYLGVEPADAPLGIRITEVYRNTPASDLGLEAGDYILAAAGRPVGYYNGTYYDLSHVMNRFADRRGNIRLTIWNFRNGKEIDFTVQLDRR